MTTTELIRVWWAPIYYSPNIMDELMIATVVFGEDDRFIGQYPVSPKRMEVITMVAEAYGDTDHIAGYAADYGRMMSTPRSPWRTERKAWDNRVGNYPTTIHSMPTQPALGKTEGEAIETAKRDR